MTVRLGFAIAAHLEPDILVVDEVLAVGDAEFQKKAIGKMQDVSKGEGRTVLFVSHNMAVSSLCSYGILLKDGLVSKSGRVDFIIDEYLKENTTHSLYLNKECESNDKDAFFEEIRVVDKNMKDISCFSVADPIFILFKINIKKNKDKYELFCMILDKRHNRVFAAEAGQIGETMLLKINSMFLVRGRYSIHAFINVPRLKQEDVAENVCHFEVVDDGSLLAKHGDYDYGCVFGDYEWMMIE
jgi:lipopolysaccharide transport system ATP-binding protein